MTEEPEVSLTQVWRWTCVDCGHVNHEDPPVFQVTEEDAEHHPGLEEAGGYVEAPETVLCALCLSLFRTTVPDFEDTDDEGYGWGVYE